MDGAQYEWLAGRYRLSSRMILERASIVTCFEWSTDTSGKIPRGAHESEAAEKRSALEGCAGGRVVELRMNRGDHGVVLCLRMDRTEERTMDRLLTAAPRADRARHLFQHPTRGTRLTARRRSHEPSWLRRQVDQRGREGYLFPYARPRAERPDGYPSDEQFDRAAIVP